VGAPEDIEDVLLHVGPRDESQGVGDIPDLEVSARVTDGSRVAARIPLTTARRGVVTRWRLGVILLERDPLKGGRKLKKYER
jgi:hypothetical protein